ncbi:MAG: hypothetical protein HYZ28_15205 [Myxococcales bacterium]|nr:hypothetical protein [Myxococcales bacterium]
MRGPLLVLAIVLSVFGCKKERPAPTEGVAPAAPGQAPEAPPPPDQPYVLTSEKLQAYLSYQEAMIQVYAGAVSDIQALGAQADAGRYQGPIGGLAAAEEVMKATERRAAAEAEARKATGLSERDVDAIGKMVTDVISKRSLASAMSVGSLIEEMEKLKAAGPPEQKEGLEASISELKKQQEELQSLTEERRRYGSGNVDLLLTREKELTRNWEALMAQAFGGKR